MLRCIDTDGGSGTNNLRIVKAGAEPPCRHQNSTSLVAKYTNTGTLFRKANVVKLFFTPS